MREMYPEQNMDTRIATSVADLDALRGVNLNSVGQGTMIYVRSTGEQCFWIDGSTAPAANGVCYVPTFISDTAEYQADPTTVPGRFIVHSRGIVGAVPLLGMYAPARAATTANLAATLQSDDVTLQANANGALSAVDGVTLAVGDRVLVKNQTAKEANGIYVVTSLGGVSAKWAFVRAPDMAVAASVVPAMQVAVSEGTVNGGMEFALVATLPVTLGTTEITFRPITQISEATLVAGTITISNQWVTTKTFVGIEVKTPGGTMGTHYKVAKSTGDGTGSVTITAVDTSGVTVNTDTSVLVVKLLD